MESKITESIHVKYMNNTLQMLESLNKLKHNAIYTKDQIYEQKENINEIESIYVRLEKILMELNNISDKKEDGVVEQLIQLHLVYSDFVWQYDQMHEMIKKMIKMYR